MIPIIQWMPWHEYKTHQYYYEYGKIPPQEMIAEWIKEENDHNEKKLQEKKSLEFQQGGDAKSLPENMGTKLT